MTRLNSRIVALISTPGQVYDPHRTAEKLISKNIFRSKKASEDNQRILRLNEHLDEIEANQSGSARDNPLLNLETQMIKKNWEKLGLKIDGTKLAAKIQADLRESQEQSKEKPLEPELVQKYRQLKLFFRLEAYLSRNKKRFLNQLKCSQKSSVKALERQLQEEKLRNQQLMRMLGGISIHSSSMEKSSAMKSNEVGRQKIQTRCRTPQEKPFHQALDFDNLLRRSGVWNKSGSSTQLVKPKEPFESIKTSPENLGKKHKKKKSVGRINFEGSDFISKYSFRPQSRDSHVSKGSHFRTVDHRTVKLNTSSEVSGVQRRQIGDSVKTTIQYFKSLARTINSGKTPMPEPPVQTSNKQRGSKQGSDLTRQLAGLQLKGGSVVHQSKSSAASTKTKS